MYCFQEYSAVSTVERQRKVTGGLLCWRLFFFFFIFLSLSVCLSLANVHVSLWQCLGIFCFPVFSLAVFQSSYDVDMEWSNTEWDGERHRKTFRRVFTCFHLSHNSCLQCCIPKINKGDLLIHSLIEPRCKECLQLARPSGPGDMVMSRIDHQMSLPPWRFHSRGARTPNRSARSPVVVNVMNKNTCEEYKGEFVSSGEAKACLRNYMGSYGSIFKVGRGEDDITIFTFEDL